MSANSRNSSDQFSGYILSGRILYGQFYGNIYFDTAF